MPILKCDTDYDNLNDIEDILASHRFTDIQTNFNKQIKVRFEASKDSPYVKKDVVSCTLRIAFNDKDLESSSLYLTPDEAKIILEKIYTITKTTVTIESNDWLYKAGIDESGIFSITATCTPHN